MNLGKLTDALDVVKLSVCIRLIRRMGLRSLLWMAMFTGDDGGRPCKRYRPRIVEPDVEGFLLDLRVLYDAQPSQRSFAAVADLPNACGLDLELRVFDRPFHRIDTEYWKRALDELAEMPRPALALIDPDDGIAGLYVGGDKARDDRHVTITGIRTVFADLEARDVLVVFQHRPRGVPRDDRHWVQRAEARVREAVGTGAVIEVFADLDAVLVSATKR